MNDKHGLVITNWHVINEATAPISVHFPNGFYSLGTVQKIDRDWDLAVIAVRPPDIQPVNLASAAPRPGEMLTIAGYGSGNYRAASGRCTQYVAPGTTFPYEMVEVAVSARQGDSGGPIFNSRGELAGVLFGEGQGRTSGSYCGRVRWFLSSVAPIVPDNRPLIAEAPLRPVDARPVVTRPIDLAAEPDPPHAVAPPRQSTVSVRPASTPGDAPRGGPVVASTRSAPLADSAAPSSQAQDFGWTDIAGDTIGEQVKSVLAGIGVLALVLHALRWLSTERAAA